VDSESCISAKTRRQISAKNLGIFAKHYHKIQHFSHKIDCVTKILVVKEEENKSDIFIIR